MKKLPTQEFISKKNVTLLRDLKPLENICPEQIKAARSLLGWSQADLAKKSGYSLPAVNNIERGLSAARPETISTIRQTFEQAGVQFIDGPGVRVQNSFLKIKVLEGTGAFSQLFQNILYVLGQGDSELLLSGIDEKVLMDTAKETVLDFQRKLAQNRRIAIKSMCSPAQDRGLTFVGGEKRLTNPALFPLLPVMLYKDRVAFLMFENPLRVVVMTHETTSDILRAQFYAQWAVL